MAAGNVKLERRRAALRALHDVPDGLTKSELGQRVLGPGVSTPALTTRLTQELARLALIEEGRGADARQRRVRLSLAGERRLQIDEHGLHAVLARDPVDHHEHVRDRSLAHLALAAEEGRRKLDRIARKDRFTTEFGELLRVFESWGSPAHAREREAEHDLATIDAVCADWPRDEPRARLLRAVTHFERSSAEPRVAREVERELLALAPAVALLVSHDEGAAATFWIAPASQLATRIAISPDAHERRRAMALFEAIRPLRRALLERDPHAFEPLYWRARGAIALAALPAGLEDFAELGARAGLPTPCDERRREVVQLNRPILGVETEERSMLASLRRSFGAGGRYLDDAPISDPGDAIGWMWDRRHDLADAWRRSIHAFASERRDVYRALADFEGATLVGYSRPHVMRAKIALGERVELTRADVETRTPEWFEDQLRNNSWSKAMVIGTLAWLTHGQPPAHPIA